MLTVNKLFTKSCFRQYQATSATTWHDV